MSDRQSSQQVPAFIPVPTFRTRDSPRSGSSRDSPRQSNYYPSPRQQTTPFIPPLQFRSRDSAAYYSPSQDSPPRRDRFSPNHLVDAPPIPDNLAYTDPEAFNIDPNSAYLADAGATAAHQSNLNNQKSSENRFIGGFVGGLKRAMKSARKGSRLGTSEEAIVHGENASVDSGYASSPQVAGPSNIPLYYPRSTSRYDSSSTPSDTLHESVENTYVQGQHPNDMGNNILRSPDSLAIGSPVYVEPQYGPDYAKMDPPTPPPSDVSLNTYIARIRQFFSDINALPWVAPDRVTADYYPGLSKRHARPRLSHHPAISWQNQHALGDQQPFDILSGSSSPSASAGNYLAQLPAPPVTYANFPNGAGSSYPVSGAQFGYAAYPGGYVPHSTYMGDQYGAAMQPLLVQQSQPAYR